MLGLLAAAIAAAAPSPSPAPATSPASPALQTAVPWWERITVTVDDKGTQRSCRYQRSGAAAADCDPAMADSIKVGGKAGNGVFSKVTFERRFSPGGRVDSGKLQPGDTLLGRQVMFLTFDSSGAVTSCEVVAAAGESRPDYDCDEVKKEQFMVHSSGGDAARQAFMTILAYGHSEELA